MKSRQHTKHRSPVTVHRFRASKEHRSLSAEVETLFRFISRRLPANDPVRVRFTKQFELQDEEVLDRIRPVPVLKRLLKYFRSLPPQKQRRILGGWPMWEERPNYEAVLSQYGSRVPHAAIQIVVGAKHSIVTGLTWELTEHVGAVSCYIRPGFKRAQILSQLALLTEAVEDNWDKVIAADGVVEPPARTRRQIYRDELLYDRQDNGEMFPSIASHPTVADGIRHFDIEECVAKFGRTEEDWLNEWEKMWGHLYEVIERPQSG